MAFQLPFGAQNSGAYSPADVERKRRLAEMLTGKDIVSQEPFGAIAEGLIGARAGYENQQASEAERKGMTDYSTRLGEILSSPNATVEQLAQVAGDPWANQQQAAIVGQLLGQKLAPPEPYKPDFQTFTTPEGDVMRFDNNAPDAKPSMFYDAPDAPPALDVTGESKLRTEYAGLPGTKDFGLQTSAYQRILDSAKDSSAAGDMALIFNFMKVLDPGSTVREGEYATAANAGSVPDRIWSLYNSVIEGTKLNPTIRRDFVERAGKLFQGAAGGQERINSQYTNLANQYGYDPSRVITPVPQIGVLDPEFDITQYVNPQTGEQTAPLPVTNDAEYEAIPSGAQYTDPEGNIRVKK